MSEERERLEQQILDTQRQMEYLVRDLERARRQLAEADRILQSLRRPTLEPDVASASSGAAEEAGMSRPGFQRRQLPRTLSTARRGFLKAGAGLVALIGGSIWSVAGRPAALASGLPTTIAYQGRLSDANGNPLNGTYAMTFNLYNAQTGGTLLWSESYSGASALPVTNGLFNVMLGSQGQSPSLASVVAGNASLWLGIAVGGDPEMNQRVQLASAPYAIVASTVPAGSITDAAVSSAAAIAESKIAFSGTGHGHTGGTDGKLTPTRTYCLVTSNTPTPTNSSQDTAVQFDTTVYDPFGMHSATVNNSRITVPNSGYYLASYKIPWDGNPTGTRHVFLSQNEALVPGSRTVIVGQPVPDPLCNTLTMIVKMSANDYIGVTVNQNSGGSLNVHSDGPNSAYNPIFEVIQIA